MANLDRRILWGGLLILGGILFLLQNLGLFPVNNLVFAVLMVAAGLVFLYHLVSSPRVNWWAVIPGLILTYLGGLIIMDQLFPRLSDQIGGALFLGVIALAFWIVYLINSTFWWAVIPAGVLTTLAVVAGIDQVIPSAETGGIFFLGLGLTFILLAFLPTPVGKMKWPLIPGGILVAMGIIFSAFTSSAINYIWPVVLILAGIYLFFYRKPQF